MTTYTDITEDYSGIDDFSSDRHNSSPLKIQDQIPIFKIFGICCSLIIYQVAYSIEIAIFTPMMSNYHIPHAIICIIWMLFSTLSFFMHPLITYYSNSINSSFGRRRPFILSGGILILICFAGLFFFSDYSTKVNENTKLMKYIITLTFLFTLLIFHSAIKMVQVSSQSLFNESIPKNYQKHAKSIGSIVSSFSSTITYLLGGFDFSQYLPKINNDLKIFTSDQFLLILCFLIVLISLIFALIASREEIVSDSILKTNMNPFEEISQVLSSRPKPIIWICIIYIFSWMAYYPFLVFVTNYFGFTIYSSKSTNTTIIDEQGKSFAMLILALSQIVELMTTFILPKIIAKINMKRTYIISMSLLTIMLILSGPFKNIYALLVIYTLLGICPAIFKTIPHLLVHIIVPSEQLNIHRNILNSSASIGKMASMLLLGICVGFIELNDRIIIACGALFALVSAILCHWMILPFKPIEFDQDFVHSNLDQKKIYY